MKFWPFSTVSMDYVQLLIASLYFKHKFFPTFLLLLLRLFLLLLHIFSVTTNCKKIPIQAKIYFIGIQLFFLMTHDYILNRRKVTKGVSTADLRGSRREKKRVHKLLKKASQAHLNVEIINTIALIYYADVDPNNQMDSRAMRLMYCD